MAKRIHCTITLLEDLLKKVILLFVEENTHRKDPTKRTSNTSWSNTKKRKTTGNICRVPPDLARLTLEAKKNVAMKEAGNE